MIENNVTEDLIAGFKLDIGLYGIALAPRRFAVEHGPYDVVTRRRARRLRLSGSARNSLMVVPVAEVEVRSTGQNLVLVDGPDVTAVATVDPSLLMRDEIDIAVVEKGAQAGRERQDE